MWRTLWRALEQVDTAQSTLRDMFEGIMEENGPETPSWRSSQQLKMLHCTKFALLIALAFIFNVTVSQKECFVGLSDEKTLFIKREVAV